MTYPRGTGEKILVVDDEANMRSFLLRHFEETGTECIASPSALDALDKMKHQTFSLVISDVMMPGMSGMELLRLAREQHPEMAFIMITGLTDINTAVDSIHTGAFDFITKPFELSAMRRAVDRALERRRLLLENRFHREALEQKIRERTFELNEALHDVEESYKITLEALVTALDAREHETRAHSQRVREYAVTLAQNLGLKHDDLVQTGCDEETPSNRL
jgi:DNA-binding NtrC family response regulator